MKKYIILSIILVLFLSCTSISIKKTDSLDSIIADCEKQFNKKTGKSIPGAVIVFIENGEIYYQKAFGYKDKNTREAMSIDTIFQVASISKTVFALTVMKLVQDRIINLDNPINSYLSRWNLPDSKYDKNEVTPRRILAHTAGLSTSGYGGYKPGTQLPSIEQSLSKGIYSVKLKRNPGEKWEYSGGGYTVLQLAIEEKLGQELSEYTKVNVFKQMGMINSSYVYESSMNDKLAKPYNSMGVQIPNYLYTETAAAGLYTTALDLAKMIIEIMNCNNDTGNNLIINKELLELMMTPEINIGKNELMGMGLFICDVGNGIKTYGHSGGNRGWKAHFEFAPEKNNGIIILTNGDSGRNRLINPLLSAWKEYIIKK